MVEQLPLVAAFIESGFIIGAVAMAFGIRRMSATARKERTLKVYTYFIIVHIVTAAAFFGHPVFTSLFGAIILVGLYEMVSVSRHRGLTTPPAIAALLLFLLLGAAGIRFAIIARPGRLLYCYLIVAVLDSYSQLTGQLVGKHKLAPAISPNKSIEGVLGGSVAAMITALVFHRLAGSTLLQAVAAGALLSIIGTIGDLSASWYKRYNGVRNYSKLLPGQGGCIDRFNSLIAVLPVFHLFCMVTSL